MTVSFLQSMGYVDKFPQPASSRGGGSAVCQRTPTDSVSATTTRDDHRKQVRVLTDLIDAADKRGNTAEALRYLRELGDLLGDAQ